MKFALFLLLIFTLNACSPNYSSNNLQTENSKYLAQHSKNPVWWQTWSPEVIKHSKKENKLIFLSIGYSSCHWCSEMNRKVFSNSEFATVVNKNFVSIKVDREVRPDLDGYFMRALNFITKSGGWPITLVLTPELHPIFGATFVPQDKMIYILQEIQKSWETQTVKLKARGQGVQDFLVKKPSTDLSFVKDRDLLKKYYQSMTKLIDQRFGGKKGAIKFPINGDLRLLMRYDLHNKKSQALGMVKKTLDRIHYGGLFDHIDGGFHRFSTDQRWEIPHFEKMLYDQASFIQSYLEYFQIQKNESSKKIIEQTLSFLLQNLYHPEGGFYGSTSGESPDGKNTYYTWTQHEVNSFLSPKLKVQFNRYFKLSSANKKNGAHRTLLRKNLTYDDKFANLISIISKKRSIRPAPEADKKIVTAWNGLLLSSLTQASRLWPQLGLNPILKKSFKYLIDNHQNWQGHLYRMSIGKKGQVDGVLADYAFLIHALIEHYQTSFDPGYLELAFQLQKTQDKLFYDSESGSYFFSQQRNLLLREYKSFQEGVRPSAQAITFYNLLRLHKYSNDTNIAEKSDRLLASYPDFLESHPRAYPYMLMALDFKLFPTKELVIVGSQKECQRTSHSLFKSFFPYIVIACQNGKSTFPAIVKSKVQIGNQLTFYVCDQGSCKKPTSSIEEATQQLFVASPTKYN